MAFPVVAARSIGRTTASNTTTHAITLPTGISAGDLLVVVFAVDQVPTITVDTGVSGSNWNELTAGSNGTIVRSNVFWKIAEGSDALTLTTSTTEQSSHACLRITGGYGVTGTSANGSSTNSNPPNHAGPDGTQDYLWIATRAGDSTVVATVAPASFTDLQTQAAAGTAGASVNTAERSLNAASLDPGTFTSASEQWVSFTLAVTPVIPAQSITGTLYSLVNAFGAGVVTAGAVTIAGALFAGTPAFGAGAVTQGGGGQSITGAIYSDGDTFGAGSVAAGPATLTGTSYTDPDTFGAGSVARGPVTITGAAYTDPDAFGAGVVSIEGGPQSITGAAYTDADAFGAGAVTQSGDEPEVRPSGGWLPIIYLDAQGNPVDLEAKVEAAIQAAPEPKAAEARVIRSEIDLSNIPQIIAGGLQDQARIMADMIDRIDAALAMDIRARIEAAEDDDAAVSLLLMA